MEKSHTAVIVVDMQRGFMPHETNPFVQLPGFAELPVEGGNETVQPANRLLEAAAKLGMLIATTQDWHPYETAHFAAEDTAPDFDATWPRHCVGGSAGAELHPSLVIPEGSARFIKGMEHMQPGDEDLSYSPFYAIEAKTGSSLPEWIAENEIDEVVIFGLALDKCVRAGGLDLRQKLGLRVLVAVDATRPVTAEGGAQTLAEFAAAGIEITTTDEWIAQQLQQAV